MPPQENKPSTQPVNPSPLPSAAPVLGSDLYTTGSGMNSTGTFGAPKKSRKKLWIILSAVALVLIAAGSALAYMAFVFQNPNKVVSDALTHAIDSKSVSVTGDIKAMSKTSDGKEEEVVSQFSMAIESTKISANLNATINGEDYGGTFISPGNKSSYFKIKNVKGIIKNIFGEEAAAKQFKPFITKVNEKWIKLDQTADDAMTKQYNQQQNCYDDAMDALHKSASQRQQLVKVYQDHPLFTVKNTGEEKVGTVDSFRMELKPNESKYPGFVTALKQTEAFKAFNKCSDGTLADTLNETVKNQTLNNETTGKVELWISKWEHHIMRVKISTNEKNGSTATVTMNPTFNKPVTVEEPSESLSLKQLYESFLQALLGSNGGSSNGLFGQVN